MDMNCHDPLHELLGAGVRKVAAVDRLSSAEMLLLRPEEFGWREDIGALAMLDGPSLFTSDGSFRLDEVREAIADRLHLVSRFRQLLVVPRRGLGAPLWIDDSSFDVAEHVRVIRLPAGAGESDLLLETERLRRRPFDRSRPLWEMWFLTGLADHVVALFMKMHHSIADGVAGLVLLGAFLDAGVETPQAAAVTWKPSPRPSTKELFADNVSRRGSGVAVALWKLAHPVVLARDARAGAEMMRALLGREHAPTTSINRPIGPDRALAILRTDLETTRAVAHAHHGTVNDVLMASIAGGLRELLLERGEPVEDVTLRATVPVSLHAEDEGEAKGNHDGMILVPLPVGLAEPGRRLEVIAAETSQRKKHVLRPPSGVLARSGFMQRAMLRRADRQRFANIYAANVPGPTESCFFAGAPLVELFPVVPVTGNFTISVGALSYAGQFNVTIVSDVNACPDIETFTAGMRRTVETLESSVRLPAVTFGTGSNGTDPTSIGVSDVERSG